MPLMTNAEAFRYDFGIYATELWAMTEAQFLEWLNAECDRERPADMVVMSGLINRQAAIEEILGCCPSCLDSEYECGYDDGLIQVVHRLKHLPTIDAVPVVRCKDCVWCDERGYCNKHEMFVENCDWYCADGERKDDDMP